jgi:hypothetical protein
MTKTVIFKEALHVNTTFSGEFQVIRGPYQKPGQKRDCMFKIYKDGAITRVHAFNVDYQIKGESGNVVSINPHGPTDDALDEMSDENLAILDERIRKRFKVMGKLTESVIAGNTRALIISGASGIGKTYMLEERLSHAQRNGEINKFTILRGKISAIALYAQLYLHKDEGDVLVLDDIDVVFGDETSLNLLKGALDTTKRRHLNWLTASTWLQENGIDDEFDYHGSCVFITNKNFDQMIESGSALSDHLRALLGRAIYLDLAIHTKLEVMVRIKQVVNETELLYNEDIDETQKELLMDWLWDKFPYMRELSIRTVMKIGGFMRTDMDDWEEMAEVTQIKSVRRA